jgi:hypothetical protein
VTDDEIRELKAKLMEADIANKAADSAYKLGLLKYQPWKLVITTVVSALLAIAAAIGAGVGVGNLIWAHRDPPSSSQPMFPPGTVITIPPAAPAPGPGK